MFCSSKIIQILTWFQGGYKKKRCMRSFRQCLPDTPAGNPAWMFLKYWEKLAQIGKLLIYSYICISTPKGSKQDKGLVDCSQKLFSHNLVKVTVWPCATRWNGDIAALSNRSRIQNTGLKHKCCDMVLWTLIVHISIYVYICTYIS